MSKVKALKNPSEKLKARGFALNNRQRAEYTLDYLCRVIREYETWVPRENHMDKWFFGELRSLLFWYSNMPFTVIIKDDMPAFAGFMSGSVEEGKPLIAISLENLLGTVACGDVPAAELPYMAAECIMHEVIHGLEELFNVAFNEERVETLVAQYVEKYRKEGEA